MKYHEKQANSRALIHFYSIIPHSLYRIFSVRFFFVFWIFIYSILLWIYRAHTYTYTHKLKFSIAYRRLAHQNEESEKNEQNHFWYAFLFLCFSQIYLCVCTHHKYFIFGVEIYCHSSPAHVCVSQCTKHFFLWHTALEAKMN